ncbi:MAG TPA: CmcJ/NvfI family oxidoreductase [Sphingomicrobium sp.]|nr:CmcJ/NvfI family oxidoreductase [Sphingomicrobium sp.]
MRAELSGFLSRDFTGEVAPPMDLGLAPAAEYEAHQVEMNDGRALQARTSSPAEFFAGHGFALLPHETRVQDWDRDVGSVYGPEVVDLVRKQLLPGRRVEILQGLKVMRRGPEQRYYAQRIHADGPLTPEVYAQNIRAFGREELVRRWERAYAREEVVGFVSIGFWRTTNMAGPLRHMPLAICDPNSVEGKDIVPTTSRTIAPAGKPTHHLVLRHNPDQSWFYYPAMTGAEVLAMTVCAFWKEDPGGRPKNVFHTAFRDPTTPPDAEPRQSCEFRVGVMIFSDRPLASLRTGITAR